MRRVRPETSLHRLSKAARGGVRRVALAPPRSHAHRAVHDRARGHEKINAHAGCLDKQALWLNQLDVRALATKRARPIYILDTDQGAISRFPPHPEKESSYGLGVRVPFEKDAVVLEYSQGHFDPAFSHKRDRTHPL